MNYSDIIILIVAGTFGGFLSGLLGVGGGIIFVPILDMVFKHLGIPEEMMVPCILSNSLFIIIFTGILNSRRQYLNNNFYFKQSAFAGLGGNITALATTWITINLITYNKASFNLLFVCLLTPFILKMLFMKKNISEESKPVPEPKKFFLSGLATGFFTALSGLGGGMVMIPLFHDIMKVDIKKATSISAGTVPFLAFPLVVYYIYEGRNIVIPNVYHWGYIILPVSLILLSGVLFTVSWGVNVSKKLPAVWIRRIFATFSIIVIVKMTFEALYKLF